MGYVEDVQAMELSDDVKAQLITAHNSEIEDTAKERDSLKAKSKVATVEKEIEDWGLSDHPGLAKYVRRTLLSPDSEQPGAVLLSDSEMGLSGDSATGATGREETSVADVVRNIFKLMPHSEDGRLNLSDQAISSDDHGRPEKGDDDPDDKTNKARANLAKHTGKATKRTGKRYGQEVTN